MQQSWRWWLPNLESLRKKHRCWWLEFSVDTARVQELFSCSCHIFFTAWQNNILYYIPHRLVISHIICESKIKHISHISQSSACQITRFWVRQEQHTRYTRSSTWRKSLGAQYPNDHKKNTWLSVSLSVNSTCQGPLVDFLIFFGKGRWICSNISRNAVPIDFQLMVS